MSEEQSTPRWIVVRLGDDSNWWLEQASDEFEQSTQSVGVLDPQQVAYLKEALDEYHQYGYTFAQFAAAFRPFVLEAEIDEGRLRLAAAEGDVFELRGDLFAMPIVGEEDEGPYIALLDAISAARVLKLNATHHYARNCTEYEMYEELEALDADRYFSGDAQHAFDEINEILEWSPAEWDDSSSG